MNRGGAQGGAWSRYVFPWNIQNFAHLDGLLYMRHGDTVSYADKDATDDNGTEFEGIIQWPWLDFGRPGVLKSLIGFEVVSTGTSEIEIGYDQSNLGAFTTAYPVPVDSVPGQVIAMPLMAPTMSVKLTYDGGQAWEWNMFSLYLKSQRPTS